VCSYLEGFDAARDSGPLMGFQPWLVLNRNGGNNVGWPVHVMMIALGEMPGSDISELSKRQNRDCLSQLGALLGAFFDERNRRGVEGILHDYAKWLLRKKWYEGPLRR
jgi:hypothetical protein